MDYANNSNYSNHVHRAVSEQTNSLKNLCIKQLAQPNIPSLRSLTKTHLQIGAFASKNAKPFYM